MKNLQSFTEFVNEQTELNELNWAKVPFTGAWRKARKEKKKAEDEAKAQAKEDELDSHNERMLKMMTKDYNHYTAQIKKNFKDMPDLVDDKILWLKHFFWSTLNDEGWNTKTLAKLHKSNRFDSELERLMNHKTNPRGASFPPYVWYEDLEPDLRDIHKNITSHKGYSQEYL